MKSKLIFFLLPVLFILGYFLIVFSMPKYAGIYFVVVLMVLADLYLWSSIKKAVFNYRKWLMILISVLYWLPFSALIALAVGSLIVPIINWNDVFRTYLVGFILIFYTAKLFPVIFLLLADIVRLIDRFFHLLNKEKREVVKERQEGLSRSRFLQYMGYITGGLVLGTMFTGMFKWVYQFNVVKEQVRLPHLPGLFSGLKIVQISDMHLGSWTSLKPLEQAIEMVNEMQPDLILFTGDLVNFATKEAYRFEDTLKKLHAQMGVFTTLGNHDYGDYVTWPSPQAKEKNLEDLYALYNRLGWKMLNNENVVFERAGEKLALVGVENWGASPRFPKYGDINKALRGAENAAARILMSHDPTHWDDIIVPGNYNIDITLSGHTHGFQFGIETPRLKWSPAQWMYKHWAGLYHDKTGRYLYVNRGLGVIGYPGRIGILPEITLLELVS